jgi:hypothetical protein
MPLFSYAYKSIDAQAFCFHAYTKHAGVTPLDADLQTRSAMFVSILWKKKSPPSSTMTTPTADAAIAAPGGCPCPVSAHRNPSITPAIGFSPYSQRHFAGTSELGYATGDANIQN